MSVKGHLMDSFRFPPEKIPGVSEHLFMSESVSLNQINLFMLKLLDFNGKEYKRLQWNLKCKKCREKKTEMWKSYVSCDFSAWSLLVNIKIGDFTLNFYFK